MAVSCFCLRCHPASLPPPVGAALQESGRHLPMGLQIVGREWDEAGIIGLAHVFEATWVCDPQAKPMVA